MKPGIRFFPSLLPLALLLLAHALQPTGATADIGEVGNHNADMFRQSEVHPRSGVLVAGAPVMGQTTVTPWISGKYEFHALYSYVIHARVLGKEHYMLDRESQLSPYDLVLGWQEMSDSNVISKLNITQGNRWYHYYWTGAPPVTEGAIPLESGNMHIIPADERVLQSLRKVAKGNVIEIEGYLVSVRGADGWSWTSGTSPDATGPHGCKLIWATKITIER